MSETMTPKLEPILWHFLLMAAAGVALGWLLSEVTGGDDKGTSSDHARPTDVVPKSDPPVAPRSPRSVRVVAETVEVHTRGKGQRPARAASNNDSADHKE